MTHHVTDTAPIAALTLADARARIRKDFSALVDSVSSRATLPSGHTFNPSPALSAEQELTWNDGCEVRSATGGLSLHAGPSPVSGPQAVADQVRIELRYFHPEIEIEFAAEGALGPDSIKARPGQTLHQAHLWAERGPNIVGQSQPLFPPANLSAATIEELADQAIEHLAPAMAQFQQDDARADRGERPRG